MQGSRQQEGLLQISTQTLPLVLCGIYHSTAVCKEGCLVYGGGRNIQALGRQTRCTHLCFNRLSLPCSSLSFIIHSLFFHDVPLFYSHMALETTELRPNLTVTMDAMLLPFNSFSTYFFPLVKTFLAQKYPSLTFQHRIN